MQGLTEISLGILLTIGLLTRPAATVAFLSLGSLWISEWGIGWIWELLVPVMASLGSRLGAPAGNWAWTRGCRNGGHRLRGGCLSQKTPHRLRFERDRLQAVPFKA